MKYTEKDLKISAAINILESELDNESKLELIKFVKTEATEIQLKSIILNQRMPMVVTERIKIETDILFNALLKENMSKEKMEKERARAGMKHGLSLSGAVTGGMGAGIGAAGADVSIAHNVAKNTSKAFKSMDVPLKFQVSKAGAAQHILKGAAKGAAASAVGYGVYRGIRSLFDKCTRDCGTFKINTPPRQLCMAKCKLAMAVKIKDKEKISKWQERVSALTKIVAELQKKKK